MIRRLTNEVYGQWRHVAAPGALWSSRGIGPQSADRDARRLDRATPQLASDMPDQAASTLRSRREPFDCLRDLRISGGSGCLASNRTN
jgi:hypothetical protein